MTSVLLLGATGLVGLRILDLLVLDPGVSRIIAPGRRPLPPRDKVLAPVLDLSAIPPDVDWLGVDSVICAFGTTIRTAGSKDDFRKVDHDIPLTVARQAHAHGASCLVLVSARGADPASPIFYLRTKGELEQDLERVGFASLAFIRPGLIGGTRAERRPAEDVSSAVLRRLAPVLPRSFRINPAERIARAAVNAAATAQPGVQIIPSGALT